MDIDKLCSTLTVLGARKQLNSAYSNHYFKLFNNTSITIIPVDSRIIVRYQGLTCLSIHCCNIKNAEEILLLALEQLD